MVVAVLPLTGLHWTYPEGASARQALADSMLLSLPIFVPLPFLLVGCLVALAVQPATRTASALFFVGVALLVGGVGLWAVLTVL